MITQLEEKILLKGFEQADEMGKQVHKKVHKWISKLLKHKKIDLGWLDLTIQDEGGLKQPVGVYLNMNLDGRQMSAFDYADKIGEALERVLDRIERQFIIGKNIPNSI